MTETKAKDEKGPGYKCPLCGELYEDKDTVCVGKAEAGHPNEPTKVQTVAAVEKAEPEPGE